MHLDRTKCQTKEKRDTWTVLAAWTQTIGLCFFRCLAAFKVFRIFNSNNSSITCTSEQKSKTKSTRDSFEDNFQIDKELRTVRWVQDSKQWQLKASAFNLEMVAKSDGIHDISFRSSTLSWKYLPSRKSNSWNNQLTDRPGPDCVCLDISQDKLEQPYQINKVYARSISTDLKFMSLQCSQPQTSSVHSWFIPMLCARCRRQAYAPGFPP
jgi:hypothetical protein